MRAQYCRSSTNENAGYLPAGESEVFHVRLPGLSGNPALQAAQRTKAEKVFLFQNIFNNVLLKYFPQTEWLPTAVSPTVSLQLLSPDQAGPLSTEEVQGEGGGQPWSSSRLVIGPALTLLGSHWSRSS